MRRPNLGFGLSTGSRIPSSSGCTDWLSAWVGEIGAIFTAVLKVLELRLLVAVLNAGELVRDVDDRRVHGDLTLHSVAACVPQVFEQ